VSEPLTIGRRHLEEMIQHCLEGRPLEACGLLGSANGRVVKVFKMTNAAASPLRYSLDPKEQLAVYRTLDERGWELAGVFHSHTHTDAYPSPTDVRLASEDVPYLILSLAHDDVVVRAFRIAKESWTATEGEVEELPLVVDD
jgi:[CysO sulfur-carrier protein]-S-L-cysteine hydrolase